MKPLISIYKPKIKRVYSIWQYHFYLIALGNYLLLKFAFVLCTWKEMELSISISSRFAAASGILLAINLITMYGLIWSIPLICVAYMYIFGFENKLELVFLLVLLFFAIAATKSYPWHKQKKDWSMSPWLIYPAQLLFLSSFALWSLSENDWQLAWMQLLFLIFVFDPRWLAPAKIKTKETPILFFDGLCVFCNFWVKFLLQEDYLHTFRFASLQTKTAMALLPKKVLDKPKSLVLYENKKLVLGAMACLQIAHRLGGIWRLGASLVGLIVPNFMLEYLYQWISLRRYRWFGRLETCTSPSKEQKCYFLD